jgi:peptidyl-prolyl cis-trans isomerase D
MGTKGNISVVETEFGYHIIEVLDVSASRHNSYSVAQIFKAIAPSEETNQKIFSEANQFGGVNNTAELFDKGVHDKNLVLRIADKVKEGDRQLTNISGAKDVVRWAYAAKKGEVSTFSFPDKHIVAKLSGIKNKGLLPLDDVKEEVVSKVILEKKADQYFAEFNKQAGNSKNVTEIAAKMGLDVLKSENLFLNNMMVEGIGQDDLFVGTAAGMKSGATSKPSLGSQGVFVLNVSAIETLPVPENYQSEKLRIEQELSGRTDYDVMNALQAMSDIEDHKSRID